MRGTPFTPHRMLLIAGIIPAYAGNTCHTADPCPSAWDHPRVCGEHLVDREPTKRMPGSSPRMRGTRRFGRADCPPPGIIPAYAGNTHLAGLLVWCGGDHPRVCGEHSSVSFLVWWLTGSSPRMRGTRPFHSISSCDAVGIIPAYAGNTRVFAWLHAGQRDHPRVCGEHFRRRGVRQFAAGSSPRMRGTHGMMWSKLRWSGIIPAYAGNTCRRPFRIGPKGDHPRVCGEHTSVSLSCGGSCGSSPRMRGTLRRSVVIIRQ